MKVVSRMVKNALHEIKTMTEKGHDVWGTCQTKTATLSPTKRNAKELPWITKKD